MSMLPLILLAFVVCVLGEQEEVRRDIGYDSYDTPVGYADKWNFNAIPSSTECVGVMKPLVAGLLIGALVKIPLLLLGKLFLLKLAAPLAVAGALVPLGLFSLYRVAVSQQSGMGGGNSTSRMLPQGCLQATACSIGSVAPKSAISTTSWVLKMLAESGDQVLNSSEAVVSYREAFMKGASSKSCPEYPCPFF